MGDGGSEMGDGGGVSKSLAPVEGHSMSDTAVCVDASAVSAMSFLVLIQILDTHAG